MAELCNCPMLDTMTPLMSWSNTPIVTPRGTPMLSRRTPLPTPRGTPMLSPRQTPKISPRTTPRATPTPQLPRRGYEHRSPSITSSHLSIVEDMLMPPPRRKYVQAPEIFSSFSNQTIEEGGSVEFKCFVSCAPLTTTTWERDGVPMLSGTNISLSEKTGMRILKLHNVKMGDAGTYRMTITNKSGFTNCSAMLNVTRRTSVRAKEYSGSASSGSNRNMSTSHHFYPTRLYSSYNSSSPNSYTSSYASSSTYISSYNSVRYL